MHIHNLVWLWNLPRETVTIQWLLPKDTIVVLLEKKFFEFKKEGYKDGIKRKQTS